MILDELLKPAFAIFARKFLGYGAAIRIEASPLIPWQPKILLQMRKPPLWAKCRIESAFLEMAGLGSMNRRRSRGITKIPESPVSIRSTHAWVPKGATSAGVERSALHRDIWREALLPGG